MMATGLLILKKLIAMAMVLGYIIDLGLQEILLHGVEEKIGEGQLEMQITTQFLGEIFTLLLFNNQVKFLT